MKKIVALMALAAAAGAANAQWAEIPDAPSLVPGQITVGVGALPSISGSLGHAGLPDDYEDLYCIYIHDPVGFSATTVGGAAFDTQLWLFNMAGMGVSFNDDSVGLLSTLTGAFVPGPGHYVIGISRYDNDALSPGGAMWADTPFAVERAPDGPGAPGPLVAWDHGSPANAGPYTIFLTGASYCEVPAPGAAALLGIAGLVGFRRRR